MFELGNRTKIFTGNANRQLAESIAKRFRKKLGKMEVIRFNDGEVQVEVNEVVRGCHILLVQPTCPPVNQNIMELMVMADALMRSDVQSITAIIPYYGYARQDCRPGYSRTPISARLVADMLEMVGIRRIITVDLHARQEEGFFSNKCPVTNLSAGPDLVADVWRKYHGEDFVVVSPDVGGVVRARSVAKQLDDAELAIIDKRRPEAGKAKVMNIIGEVEGRVCVMLDDMIDTAGTLCKGALALKDKGASKVVAYATHPVFSGNAFTNIAESVLDEVVVTDTIPVPIDEPSGKIRTISIASLIAEATRRVRAKESVSDMYVGA